MDFFFFLRLLPHNWLLGRPAARLTRTCSIVIGVAPAIGVRSKRPFSAPAPDRDIRIGHVHVRRVALPDLTWPAPRHGRHAMPARGATFLLRLHMFLAKVQSVLLSFVLL